MCDDGGGDTGIGFQGRCGCPNIVCAQCQVGVAFHDLMKDIPARAGGGGPDNGQKSPLNEAIPVSFPMMAPWFPTHKIPTPSSGDPTFAPP